MKETTPNPNPDDTTAPSGSFGVSSDANPPFRNDSGGNIGNEKDNRVVKVEPGGTFYAQVAYEDPSGIRDVEVNLVNRSPEGVSGTLDPSQQFFTLGEVAGTCDLSSDPVSVTCIYPITVAEDAVNIDELDGAEGEFAYVFRTKVTDAAGNQSDEAIRGYVTVTDDTTPNPPGEDNGTPRADFTAEQEEGSLSVKFSAEPSSDPDGDPLSYTWDFGDGSAGSSRDFTKTYREAKDYEVTLTVSDGEEEDSVTKTVSVQALEGDTGDEGRITVTSTSGAASLEDECTLRAAITAANTDAAVGGCPAGSGADTIILAEGATYTLSEADNGTGDDTSALPRVASEISLEGNGATVERSGAEDTPPFRLFYVAEAGTLTLDNATVRGGELIDTSYQAPDVVGPSFLNLGSLTLTNVTISDGYIEGASNGVAVHNLGTLRLERSTAENHSANDPYGDNSAIFNAGEATLVDTLVRNPPEGSIIGAIYNAAAGTLDVQRSTVTRFHNFETFAGVENDGEATLTDSTIFDNSGDKSNAGILNRGTMKIQRSLIADNSGFDSGQGGIFNSGTLTLLNSTLSNNSADFGAIVGNTGRVDIRYSTLKDNVTGTFFFDPEDEPAHVIENAGTLTLYANIIENGGGDTLLNCTGSGTFISEGYNVASDGSCDLDRDTDDLADFGLGLAPLRDNGGETLTHALPNGTFLLDAVPADACEVDTDQRGVSRPQGEACDIGAFELER